MWKKRIRKGRDNRLVTTQSHLMEDFICWDSVNIIPNKNILNKPMRKISISVSIVEY